MFAVRRRQRVAPVVFFVLLGTISWPEVGAASTPETALPRVEPNGNRRAAGSLDDGTLRLALRAGVDRRQPEVPGGPTLEIEALGEIGKPLTVPAPLIRVVEGTEIVVSVRNERNAPLVVHGFCTGGGSSCDPLEVAPQQTREVRFASCPAGAYHYWASTIGAPVLFRELAGALVVDPSC